MPLEPPTSVGWPPERVAAAIARKQGWTAPSNILAMLAVVLAAAALCQAQSKSAPVCAVEKCTSGLR